MSEYREMRYIDLLRERKHQIQEVYPYVKRKWKESILPTFEGEETIYPTLGETFFKLSGDPTHTYLGGLSRTNLMIYKLGDTNTNTNNNISSTKPISSISVRSEEHPSDYITDFSWYNEDNGLLVAGNEMGDLGVYATHQGFKQMFKKYTGGKLTSIIFPRRINNHNLMSFIKNEKYIVMLDLRTPVFHNLMVQQSIQVQKIQYNPRNSNYLGALVQNKVLLFDIRQQRYPLNSYTLPNNHSSDKIGNLPPHKRLISERNMGDTNNINNMNHINNMNLINEQQIIIPPSLLANKKVMNNFKKKIGMKKGVIHSKSFGDMSSNKYRYNNKNTHNNDNNNNNSDNKKNNVSIATCLDQLKGKEMYIKDGNNSAPIASFCFSRCGDLINLVSKHCIGTVDTLSNKLLGIKQFQYPLHSTRPIHFASNYSHTLMFLFNKRILIQSQHWWKTSYIFNLVVNSHAKAQYGHDIYSFACIKGGFGHGRVIYFGVSGGLKAIKENRILGIKRNMKFTV